MEQDCIFCKIAAGEIPCAKIYETDTVLAFLDIAPVNKGHALIIPKAHYATALDIPADLAGDLLEAQQRVGRAVMKATGASGLNSMVNCFESAGQLVFHAHWHVIPRFDDDGLALWPQAAYKDNEEMTRLAQAVQKALAG